jgi:hypothetical protein
MDRRKSVGIVITTYMSPKRLNCVLTNMKWAGWPSIPTYIVVDAPYDGWKGHMDVMGEYDKVCRVYGIKPFYMSEWGCMQGSIEVAMRLSSEDWIIYVPDDVLFTKGSLYNEYAGVLVYGQGWVGGIQAPYWNADDLLRLGVMPQKDLMWEGWIPQNIPQNPHWNAQGLPRSYINLNGAGFSLNRRLWEDMHGFSTETWRLDEYAGFQAWQRGYVCLTLPGPPRIHYFGATTPDQPDGLKFHTEEAWELATGVSVVDGGNLSRERMMEWGGGDVEYPFLEMIAADKKGKEDDRRTA